MSRARCHVLKIQYALQLSEDAYREYAWEVRNALLCWENEKRLAEYHRRKAERVAA